MQQRCTECGAGGRIIRYKRGTPLCWAHYLQMRRHGRILTRTKYTPNEFIDKGDHIEIVLFDMQGSEVARALADKARLPELKHHKWHLARRKQKLYVETIPPDRGALFLHVLILGSRPGLVVDHINGDGLDCRRFNLRHVTQHQNVLNKRRKLGRSGRIGVAYRKSRKRWVAYMVTNKHRICRSFRTKAEAIKAREAMELQQTGTTATSLLG